MRSNHYSKLSENNICVLIAQEAARLIIEDGILNYQSAKLKAANRFDVKCTTRKLPGNDDIDRAMQQYHQIYSGGQQQQRLTQQRSAALEAMEFLEPFSPHLSGPVLTGVAGQNCPVILHVFAETPETIIIALLDAGIPFDEKSHDVTSPHGKVNSYSRLCLQVDNVAIELYLFPIEFLRNQPKTKGLLTKRATIQQVRKLTELATS